MASATTERLLGVLSRLFADAGSADRVGPEGRTARDWAAHALGRVADWVRGHDPSVTAIEREEAANRARLAVTRPLSRFADGGGGGGVVRRMMRHEVGRR